MFSIFIFCRWCYVIVFDTYSNSRELYLPPSTAQNYSLRNRPQNRQLPDRISRITDCNFTVRMLYRNMYWLLYILDLYNCGLTVRNKRISYVMLCINQSLKTCLEARTCWENENPCLEKSGSVLQFLQAYLCSFT